MTETLLIGNQWEETRWYIECPHCHESMGGEEIPFNDGEEIECENEQCRKTFLVGEP